MKNELSAKEKVYFLLCKVECYIDCHEPVTSSRTIARSLGMSRNAVLKILRELESDEKVQKTHIGGITEDGDPWCSHGWCLRLSNCWDDLLYKKANWAVAKSTAEVWGGHAREYYATCTKQWYERWSK